jgi:hypothetical protein
MLDRVFARPPISRLAHVQAIIEDAFWYALLTAFMAVALLIALAISLVAFALLRALVTFFLSRV